VASSGTGNARAGWRVAGIVLLSLAVHGAAFAALARGRRAAVRAQVAIEVVRREPPRRPAALPAPAPAPRPAGRRPAPAKRLPVRPEPVAPPPPALASAPREAPSAPRPIPRVGISLGSTVSSGAFAAGVGNTASGKAEGIAADPATVRPYSGGAVPAARLSAQPRPIELPRIAYPPDARRDGTEGTVLLLLGVDAWGRVTSVRVVQAASPSLAAAAQEGARRFRFTPALLDGAPVPTEIRFTYAFLLE
jgi:protein TonB